MNGDGEDPLEASWASLDFFNKTHCGRICGGPELERALTLEEDDTDDENENQDFIIPELPRGTILELLIHSTWGDPYYVGLNGIQVFGEDGKLSIISSIEEDARTRGEGQVPGFVGVENLIDQAGFRSRDDTRLWWAPYRRHVPYRLVLRLSAPASVAMIRIWNYNKSRVHASRGVRVLELRLDDEVIFKGEISKADTHIEEDECPQLGDTILFTSSEEILEHILANDKFLAEDTEEIPSSPPQRAPRPSTGELMTRKLERQEAKTEPKKEPLWNALSVEGSRLVLKGQKIQLELLGNWGAEDTIGLGCLKVIGRKGELLSLPNLRATASVTPPGAQNVWKALDGACLSGAAEEQWLSPWDGERPVTLTIRFPGPVQFVGFAVWNYNASLEMSYSGVRVMNVYVDGDVALSGVELRKAPGNVLFDYVQELFFGDLHEEASPAPSPAPLLCVRGFTFQIQLHSTWGDEFYIGLNGIRMLDEDDNPIPLLIKNLAAFPESVNVLENVEGDPRSSDKLIDDFPDTEDPAHMWLAPLLPSQMNRIYVVFDKPMYVRAVEVWNYRKTPGRGARDVLVLVDDVIVFDGEIPVSTPDCAGHLRVDLRDS